MDTDIFEQFPDRETFDKYWNENYQPVTYEDVREAFTDFVKSADGHIYLSDYEGNSPHAYPVHRNFPGRF